MKMNNVNLLDVNEYEILAKRCRIQKSVLPICTNYLRDIGIILYFPNINYSEINTNKTKINFIILKPEYLHEIIYCLFNSNNGKYISNGFISISDISLILHNYSSIIHDFIIYLLYESNILLKMNENQYFIPSLLSDKYPIRQINKLWSLYPQPDEIEQQRLYEFTFLPQELFSRLFVRLLRIRGIIGILFWKNGLIISTSDSIQQKAILTYHDKAKTLYIKVFLSSFSDIFFLALFFSLCSSVLLPLSLCLSPFPCYLCLISSSSSYPFLLFCGIFFLCFFIVLLPSLLITLFLLPISSPSLSFINLFFFIRT